MKFRLLLTGVIVALPVPNLQSISPVDSLKMLTGAVYDSSFLPVPATHVINLRSRAGDVTDSLGLFTLPVEAGDSLFFRNIAFRDTLVAGSEIKQRGFVILRRARYPLRGARIFPWGSTYEDFRRAVVDMPPPRTHGERLGLPRQDPDHIPFDMDEKAIRSPSMLISSPLTFLYLNTSRKEKSRRKLFWRERKREKYEVFDRITGPENLSNVTGLSGDELLEFMAFLFDRMNCDPDCSEIEIHSEIHEHWKAYRSATEDGGSDHGKFP